MKTVVLDTPTSERGAVAGRPAPPPASFPRACPWDARSCCRCAPASVCYIITYCKQGDRLISAMTICGGSTMRSDETQKSSSLKCLQSWKPGTPIWAWIGPQAGVRRSLCRPGGRPWRSVISHDRRRMAGHERQKRELRARHSTTLVIYRGSTMRLIACQNRPLG